MRLDCRVLLHALGACSVVFALSSTVVEARPRTKVAPRDSRQLESIDSPTDALQSEILAEFDRALSGDGPRDEAYPVQATSYDQPVDGYFDDAYSIDAHGTNRGSAQPALARQIGQPIAPSSYEDHRVMEGEYIVEGYEEYGDGEYFYEDEDVYAGDSACFDACCRAPRLWVRTDYLLWWSKGNALPPLVTTSPNETSRDLAGVLAFPQTQVLYGNERVNDDARSGGRLSFGIWLGDGQHLGIGGTFFSLGDGTSNYSQSSLGLPILARPFRDAVTGLQDAQLVAFSSTADGDIAAGWVSVSTKNEVHSADMYLRSEVHRYCNGRADLIGGYRYSRIDENLIIQDQIISTDQGGLTPVGTTIDGVDHFSVRNDFYGADVGWIIERDYGRWSLEWLTKVGLGTMRQQATIQGESVVSVPGAGLMAREGSLLAQPSNIGTYERDRFAVVPEVRLNVSYRFNSCWKATAGYTFIYWSEVLRTGHQIDYSVNTSQLSGPPLVGPAQPAFAFQSGDFWVQGLNLGLEYAF